MSRRGWMRHAPGCATFAGFIGEGVLLSIQGGTQVGRARPDKHLVPATRRPGCCVRRELTGSVYN
jgi:hypothetical protein